MIHPCPLPPFKKASFQTVLPSSKATNYAELGSNITTWQLLLDPNGRWTQVGLGAKVWFFPSQHMASIKSPDVPVSWVLRTAQN